MNFDRRSVSPATRNAWTTCFNFRRIPLKLPAGMRMSSRQQRAIKFRIGPSAKFITRWNFVGPLVSSNFELSIFYEPSRVTKAVFSIAEDFSGI